MEQSAETRTVEAADLFRLKFLQGAQLSPDGRQVVYAVSHVDADVEKEYVTLWLLSLKTGAARRLTAGLARDEYPRWSPDGRQIAFLSDRGEKPQLYLIPVDGSEARALTNLPQGVAGAPAWSPDGRHIAFTAGPAAEPPDPGQPYRVTRHVYRFDAMGYLNRVVQDLYVISVEDTGQGGDPRQLTDDTCHNSNPVWSPDGQEILYSANMFPDTHQVYRPRLWAVNLEGERREVLAGWGHAISAAWTPDGQRVVFVGMPEGRPNGTKSDLWVVDRQGGTPQCRTAGLKFGVGGRLQPDMPALRENLNVPMVTVSGDGATACVQTQIGGTIHILRVALTGPESWQPAVTGERSCIPLDGNDSHLLFAASTLDNPADLHLAAADGSQERQLTRLNADLLAQRALPTVEHLLFPGADGAEVEGWILRPPMGTAPYPTVLYIHGGPHSGFGHLFSFDFQLLAGAGYAVLIVNHRGSTGYGDGFATQIKGDWGNLDYTDLMAGVDAAIERGIADPDRLGCCGLSGGGNLTCWIVGQTERFKAAVPENPVTNWVSFYGVSDIGPWFAVEELGGRPHEIPEIYRRCSPITYAHRCTTPTLLIQGENDYRCPAEQSEQFYTVLKANGCVVEMVRLPDSAHAGTILGAPVLRRVHNQALLAWMNRYVMGIGSDNEHTT